MDSIRLVQGDDLPRVSFVVVDKKQQIISLVGCTAVKLRFKQVGGNGGVKEVDCQFNTTTSEVSFEFTNNELDDVVGDCKGEIVLYFGLKKHTVFDTIDFKVRGRLQ